MTQTVKEATGHDILTAKNFWQPTINGAEIASVKFAVSDKVEIGSLGIHANVIPLGFSNITVSISKSPGDFLNPIDAVNYQGSFRPMVFTTIKNYVNGEFQDFDWHGGSYGDTRPAKVYLAPGTYYINVKSNNENIATQYPKITLTSTDVVIGDNTFNKETEFDVLNAKLDYLISK